MDRGAQLVLIAAGFLGSQKYVTDAFGLELDGRTNVKTAPVGMKAASPEFSPQAICTGGSPWWSGPSGKAAKPPAP